MWVQLFGRLFLGFGSDGAKQGGVGIFHHLGGALGKGLALMYPEFPADITVDIFSVKL